MKIKCKQCDDIIENKEIDKEIWCSCKNIGFFNDYILYGNKNKLKEKSYEDLIPKKSLEEVVNELNKLENNWTESYEDKIFLCRNNIKI